jgi:predicted nucleic acid-binding Zn ribbon protein
MRPVSPPPRDVPALRELLPKIFERIAREGDARALHPLWSDVVGPHVSRHAKPRVFLGDVLEISVTTQGWAQELSSRSEEILQRLNGRLGRRIAQIVFVVG